MHLRWSYVCGRRLLWLPLFGALFATGQGPSGDKVAIPKAWDDAAMATLELPLAYPAGSPKHVSSDYYYRMPVRPIYKQYPVYAPGREPAGYWEWLKQQDPAIVWDDKGQKPALNTDEDWIKAGAIAFDAPNSPWFK